MDDTADRTIVLDTGKDTTDTHVLLHGRARRVARAAWIAIVAFTLIVYLLSIPVHFKELRIVSSTQGRAYYLLTEPEAAALNQLGISVDFYASYLDILAIAMLLSFVGFGLLISWRKSNNWMLLLFSLALITLGVTYNTSIESLAVADPRWEIGVLFIQVTAYTAVVTSVYLFPDGRLTPRWMIIPLIGWFFVALYDVVRTGIAYVNGTSASLLNISLLLWVTVGIIAQVYRYKRKLTLFQRQQTRWMLFGVGAAVLGFALYVLPPILFRATFHAGMPRLLYNLIGVPLFVIFPAMMVPLTLAVAILYHSLWDIDLFINRALIYLTLTGILGVLYFGAVIALQQLFVLVTGVQQSSIAIAVSTLGLAALFQPLRQRLQGLVNRRFGGVSDVVRSRTATQLMDAVSANESPGKLTGTRLGAYEIRGLLGRGGMAEVYRGRHVGLNRQVAVKVLSEQLAVNPAFRRRFEREAQLVATLHHPNIVQIYDIGEQNDIYYMAMSYINGQTLAQYLEVKGILTFAEAIPILKAIASALDYAHEKGIVHRDVKPSNVMFDLAAPTDDPDDPGRPILTDFGLAKLYSSSAGNTLTGGIMGTLNYLAPEQINSAKEIGPGTDIYALGIVAYQMLTGEVPFSGDNPAMILMGHLQRPVPNPRQIVAQIPIHAAMAIVNALAKEADERYPTASDFIIALEYNSAPLQAAVVG